MSAAALRHPRRPGSESVRSASRAIKVSASASWALAFCTGVENGKADIEATREVVGLILAIVLIVVIKAGEVRVLSGDIDGGPVSLPCVRLWRGPPAAAAFLLRQFHGGTVRHRSRRQSSSCEIAGNCGIDSGSTAIDAGWQSQSAWTNARAARQPGPALRRYATGYAPPPVGSWSTQACCPRPAANAVG